jgi:hypothetical protein
VKGIADLVARVFGYLGKSTRLAGNLKKVATVLVLASTLLAVGAQVVPALAESYRQPKDDYRGAARLVTASPPKSVVITLGCYSGLIATGLDYYFKAQGTDAQVMNLGLAMTDRVVQQVQNSRGTVWAAALTSCQEVSSGPANGVEIFPHAGMVMARVQTPQGTQVEQAVQLVRWAAAFDPNLQAAEDFLGTYSGSRKLGDNLLPSMTAIAPDDRSDEGWSWTPQADVNPAPEDEALYLTPNGPEVRVVTQLDPAHINEVETYVLTFEYRNVNLNGNLRILAAALDANGAEYRDALGNLLGSFPSGSGYRCLQLPGSADWASGAFSFTLPPGSASLTVIMRATGTGTAAFRAVELRQVR